MRDFFPRYRHYLSPNTHPKEREGERVRWRKRGGGEDKVGRVGIWGKRMELWGEC